MEKTLENSVENPIGRSWRTTKIWRKNAQNVSNSWISSNQNDGATYGIYVTIYSAKNVMETTLKKEEKIGGKNPEKYIHKLSKHQTERKCVAVYNRR